MDAEAPGNRRATRLTIGGVVVAAAIVAMLAVPSATRSGDRAEAAELSRFDDCTAMRAFISDSAAAASQGRLDYGSPPPPLAATGEAVTADAARNSAAGNQGQGGAPFAGGSDTGATNVQVAGVDELDLVDTDGVLLVTVSERPSPSGGRMEGTLRLVDPAAGRTLDAQPLPGWNHQLTWDAAAGVVWVTSTDTPGSDARNRQSGTVTRVTRVRAAGDALELDGTAQIRGALVGARRVGGRLHVVASDSGDIVTPMPVEPQDRLAGNPEGPSASRSPAPVVVERLPFEGGDVAVPCDQVWHPAGPSQPSALLVATFEAAAPTGGQPLPAEVAEVAGAGSLVYGTADALYVATTLWDEAAAATSIHRFALDGLRWTGSGRVPGVPLNQFAFDEHDGVLRVATTVDQGAVAVDASGDAGARPPAAADVAAPPRQDGVDNIVVALGTEGDLAEIGRLGGLGHPGERIRGVRFAGTTAYVVTFRQTDPLYVVDLSDPRRPRATGELQLPGFSSYLHPVTGSLLVGIGREGTEQGTLLGAQAQLFDVSDPRAPRLVDQESLGDASPAADDHHAFTVLAGGAFAVPAVAWPDATTARQPPIADAPATVRPVVAVVRMSVSPEGLDRTGEFPLEPPGSPQSDVLGGNSIRTVPVGGTIAVVAGPVGVAVFDSAGGSGRWVLFD